MGPGVAHQVRGANNAGPSADSEWPFIMFITCRSVSMTIIRDHNNILLL